MFTRLISFLLLIVWAALGAPQGAVGRAKPKLVVGIVIDQFRYDYLTRFRDAYTGGFDRLLKNGAVFTDAEFDHFPTVTAVGHSVFLTGATPALSGIVGNEWYDRGSGKMVTSVSDDSVKGLGGQGGGASPRRLLVSTVGDEMKMANGGKSRVIGISLKDRAAILPAGHMADGAYWFDGKSGNFVSSTFYFQELPEWVVEFNRERAADRYAGIAWEPFQRMPSPAGAQLWEALAASPFGNELVEAFAERAIGRERLGRNEATDLLAVSFSANDYVGHRAGPDSPQVRDLSIRTDRLLDKFLRFIDAEVGLSNVLLVLTADHGVAPLPELQQERRMPGGRIAGGAVERAVESALAASYGEGKWIERSSEDAIYLNRLLIHQKKLTGAEVERVAAEAARAVPHVFRVYTASDLSRGHAMADMVGRRVMNGFNAARSADLLVLYEPYWVPGAHGTSHGVAFGYDAHVPVIFMGKGIKPGAYRRRILPNDIAPTLAALLEVETPSGSVGRVLDEIIGE
jgi:hypothetical protein